VTVRLKLDENLAERHRVRLEAAGQDVETVRRQGLGGIEDSKLFEICRDEGRILVTLDLDFANVLAFPPAASPGLIVLRGRDALVSTVDRLIESLARALETDEPVGKLWIVEPDRLRIHLEGDD
jgi:predicted nuclease of predicted toxin-antitoxin system